MIEGQMQPERTQRSGGERIVVLTGSEIQVHVHTPGNVYIHPSLMSALRTIAYRSGGLAAVIKAMVNDEANGNDDAAYLRAFLEHAADAVSVYLSFSQALSSRSGLLEAIVSSGENELSRYMLAGLQVGGGNRFVTVAIEPVNGGDPTIHVKVTIP